MFDQKSIRCGTLAFLIAAAAAIYAPAIRFDFLNYDDAAYVSENPHIAEGLTADSFLWSLTAFHSSNWHPLTWMSHALDVSLFGMHPAGHHAVSVLLHLLNVLLLYLFLARATGAYGPALFAAGLFALHPLRVESVAWIAERKDVLSTFWALTTLLAYHHYTKIPSVLRMLPVVLAFTLGLMAKPMLITLPFVMLLLDLWPFGRLDHGHGVKATAKCIGCLIAEKLPLFALVAGSCWLTLQAQQQAMAPLESVGIAERLANAVISYERYLEMLFWPHPLATPYPWNPAVLTPLRTAFAAALLALVSTAALVAAFRGAYWFLVGWLWYLGTLVLVIGLVQVGNQALADRYTYIPLMGIGIVLAWGGAAAQRRWQIPERSMLLLALPVLTVCCALSTVQLRYWRDSETLFRHAITVTENNSVAHNNLGKTLMEQGRREEALGHFEAAVAAAPGNLDAKNNLAVTYLESGQYEKAQPLFIELLDKNPNDPEVLLNAAVLLARAGDIHNARSYAHHALDVDPNFEKAKQFLRTTTD